ncbi:unnamed protein product, partial [Rotaria sp. Silwood2]
TTTIIPHNTTTPLVTTTKNIVDKAKSASKTIKDYTESFAILFPSIFGAITVIYAILMYVIKFYKNNFKFKWSWVTIKSPAEYERRRRGTNEEVTSNENSPRIEEVYNSIDSIV